jgi:hypothetical protein
MQLLAPQPVDCGFAGLLVSACCVYEQLATPTTPNTLVLHSRHGRRSPSRQLGNLAKEIKDRNDPGEPLRNHVSKFRARNLACPTSARNRETSPKWNTTVSGKNVHLEPLPSFCVVASAFRCTVFREVPAIGLGNGVWLADVSRKWRRPTG